MFPAIIKIILPTVFSTSCVSMSSFAVFLKLCQEGYVLVFFVTIFFCHRGVLILFFCVHVFFCHTRPGQVHNMHIYIILQGFLHLHFVHQPWGKTCKLQPLPSTLTIKAPSMRLFPPEYLYYFKLIPRPSSMFVHQVDGHCFFSSIQHIHVAF